ncbi:uncharacterized protein LOC105939766 isoform X2 [Fundulus heteroclitus]|uniref:uncharacterized protein LOC105939766 isoform X2 n=1 Tax=Fundulus heteroclitus TaxID=8078 RepID=UPI00165A7062|nr:uncharacterized protein LOC105939766 isoform X2 [Fundulus heteroclitus]
MNVVENKSLHSQLRDEEAVVVENAVRLAIDSVLNVLYGLNGARTREYQRMVADRDKEIQRLEGRLTEIERELQVLRRHGCACGLFDTGTRISSNRQTGEQIRAGSVGVGPEGPAGPQECDMSLSLGVYAPPASLFSSRYQESILPSSPSCLGVTSTCTSRSSEASGLTEAARNLPTSPSSLVVKEEPCDVDAVLIEWELSEERAAESEERAGSPCPNEQNPEHLENGERQMLREETPVNPAGFQFTAGDQLKNKKKNVPMSQLTEEAQRLKRAAWRAASKRYYARKIARQQATLLQHVGPAGRPAHAQRGCFGDERRKRLTSDSPEESQMQRREVWRAASRRYYDRKSARHQTDSSQFGHLPENLNPAGATPGPNGEGPRVIRGRIMCS